MTKKVLSHKPTGRFPVREREREECNWLPGMDGGHNLICTNLLNLSFLFSAACTVSDRFGLLFKAFFKCAPLSEKLCS